MIATRPPDPLLAHLIEVRRKHQIAHDHGVRLSSTIGHGLAIPELCAFYLAAERTLLERDAHRRRS